MSILFIHIVNFPYTDKTLLYTFNIFKYIIKKKTLNIKSHISKKSSCVSLYFERAHIYFKLLN